jgi:flagellar motility protein MotE (MotC chaperone)
MKRSPLILIAGGTVSFVVVFFLTALAMGLLKGGPGPVLAALVGQTPPPPAVQEQSAGASAATEHALPAQPPPTPSPADSAARQEPVPPNPAQGEIKPSAAAPAPSPGDQPKPMDAAGDSFLSRAEALTRIEAALRQREQEVDSEKADLAALRAQLDASESRVDSLHAAGVKQIARIYDAMRPEAAAEILARLPSDLQTEIVQQMDERVAAKVLGVMDRRVAARISASLGKSAAATQPPQTGGTQ